MHIAGASALALASTASASLWDMCVHVFCCCHLQNAPDFAFLHLILSFMSRVFLVDRPKMASKSREDIWTFLSSFPRDIAVLNSVLSLYKFPLEMITTFVQPGLSNASKPEIPLVHLVPLRSLPYVPEPQSLMGHLIGGL